MTILESLKSKNPAQYILNYDFAENDNGITLMQLRNALFKVVKGKDKALHIGIGSSKDFLQKHSGKHWTFDSKTGVISPK